MYPESLINMEISYIIIIESIIINDPDNGQAK